jgi:uncharacterized protein YecE (DUF72 family)
MKSRNFKIGCSGYYYATWKNEFYPLQLPASKWLTHYSTVFNTVELNGTFYRMPKLNALKKYVEQTPADFSFTVKMNKYITHILRLKNTKQIIIEFCDLVLNGLGEKLDNILYQLPPSFSYSDENLENVLANVPNTDGSVVEFRHKTWWNEKVFEEFKKRNISFCNSDYPGLEQTFVHTTGNFYARKHGVPELFKSVYTLQELGQFASAIPKDVATSYIYFNNTWFDGAYKNARQLMKMV